MNGQHGPPFFALLCVEVVSFPRMQVQVCGEILLHMGPATEHHNDIVRSCMNVMRCHHSIDNKVGEERNTPPSNIPRRLN